MWGYQRLWEKEERTCERKESYREMERDWGEREK